MSSSDYALSIAQKYRLALSIAVLNTKPKDMTVDQYLDQIRNTISNSDGDNEISVCSDDFNMNCIDELDDCFGQNIAGVSEDIVFDDRTENTNQSNVRSQVNDVPIQEENSRSQVDVQAQNNDVQTQDYDAQTQRNNTRSQVNDNQTKANGSQLQFNDEILGNSTKDSEKSTDRNKFRRDMYREVIQVMKGVNSTEENTVNKYGFISDESSQAKPSDTMDIEYTQCFDDNDQTCVERGCMSNENSVNNFEVLNNYPNVRKENYTLIQDISDRFNNLEDLTNLKETNNLSKNQMLIKEGRNNNLKETFAMHNDKYNSEFAIDKMNEIVTCKAISVNVKEKLAKLQYTQHNTHYSPSQGQITIDNRLIIGYNNNHKTNDDKNTFDEDTEMFSQNTQDVFVDSLNCLSSPSNMAMDLTCKENVPNNIEEHRENSLAENCLPLSQDTQIDMAEDINAVTQNNIEFSPAFSQDSMHMFPNNPIDLSDSINVLENYSAFAQNKHTMEYENEHTFKPRFDNTKGVTNFDENNDKSSEITNNDCCVLDKPTETHYLNGDFETESMIPFKILEEINKMKSYLNKKCMTQNPSDSGYRSSQSKCSFKSSQSANASIGESANSVFQYLRVCPLVTASQDLTYQMSDVLGLVIDRLHEDETYPPFLEELLISVHTLLMNLYEDDCGEFDMLTIKDEQTQRIILLAKSSHIKKFAIEKINDFLQKLLDEPKETNHEIQNSVKINNLPYIFHVLQTLIQKYSVPSTQSTQEDEKTLRKTDISDIWRKKWMPNFKEISDEGTCEEKCVLKECGTILNKMIVGFMEGYSLVAYFALKCFNLLQS